MENRALGCAKKKLSGKPVEMDVLWMTFWGKQPLRFPIAVVGPSSLLPAACCLLPAACCLLPSTGYRFREIGRSEVPVMCP
jgi:hypothetical protein